MVYVCALRIKETNLILLEDERSCTSEKDADVEAGLTDRYNCTIFPCRLCCNSRDHWRWLGGVHVEEFLTVHNCLH